MKKILTTVLLLVSLSVNIYLGTRLHKTGNTPEPYQEILSEQTRTTEWETFITALAWVESRWDDSAVGTKNDVGYLQITPILVEDANRIEGFEMFTLEGRFDRNESIKLFNVIMDNYNPQHDMQLALKIWNPYSKVSYHRAVMNKYNELLNEI